MTGPGGWLSHVGARGRLVGRWLAAQELVTMVLVAVLAGGLWVFAEVSDAVIEEETHAFDERVLLAMRNPADPSDPLGPKWVEEVGRDLTALGGIAVLTLLSLAAAGYLALIGRRRALAVLAASIGGGWALSMTLKHGFARPRPDLVPHASHVYTASFPSGHAMMSAITYLTLAALLARVVPGRNMRIFVVAWAVVFTGLAGVSRVYLGVHWPTDVVAGWALGASWATAWWLVADWLERRRRARGGPKPEREAT